MCRESKCRKERLIIVQNVCFYRYYYYSLSPHVKHTNSGPWFLNKIYNFKPHFPYVHIVSHYTIVLNERRFAFGRSHFDSQLGGYVNRYFLWRSAVTLSRWWNGTLKQTKAAVFHILHYSSFTVVLPLDYNISSWKPSLNKLRINNLTITANDLYSYNS